DAVVDAQQVVLNRIVHAYGVGAGECRIPILAYAGESDNIVTPASARSVFPDTGVLPGDHFSIIRPDSNKHRSYKDLKSEILAAKKAGRPVHGTPGVTSSSVEAFDVGQPPPPARLGEEMSHVIARWNPRHRTIDFIMSPEIALAWIKELGEEGVDGRTKR